MFPYPGTPRQRKALRSKFQQLLEMSLADCLDTLTSFVSGHVMVDIIRIDEILHARFGCYEASGLSMEDVIRDKYGDDAVNLLNELI